MAEMKLIIENWNSFVNEQFDSCKEGSFNVGQFLLATDMAKILDDTEKLNAREQQIANSRLRQYWQGASKLAPALFKLGVAGAATTPAGIASTGLAVLSYAVMVDDAAIVAGDIFKFGSRNEENNAYKDFLGHFCVDQDTLDLIEDKYQKAYVEQSGVIAALKNFFASASLDLPMPDITNHLVDWLNTKSPYAQSDDTQLKKISE